MIDAGTEGAGKTPQQASATKPSRLPVRKVESKSESENDSPGCGHGRGNGNGKSSDLDQEIKQIQDIILRASIDFEKERYAFSAPSFAHFWSSSSPFRS